MPMLDEDEFAEVSHLYSNAMQDTKRHRAQYGVSLKHVPTGEYFQPVLQRFERLTGYKETNPNAVWHHRLSLYGPPCKRCGKPLRTPKARLCGSCMFPIA
jgi:hypothetical protein